MLSLVPLTAPKMELMHGLDFAEWLHHFAMNNSHPSLTHVGFFHQVHRVGQPLELVLHCRSGHGRSSTWMASEARL